jgi:hypothetical protein
MSLKSIPIALAASTILFSIRTAEAAGTRVCGNFSAYSPTSGWTEPGWKCSQDGGDSQPLNLGDDTGWRRQQLLLYTSSSERLCMRHKQYSSSTGWSDSGWICSQNGNVSPPIGLGDDTGWTNQSLQILNYSSTPVCFRHTRYSPTSHGTADTGLVCSKNGLASDPVGIGDDTGWVNQQLQLRAY